MMMMMREGGKQASVLYAVVVCHVYSSTVSSCYARAQNGARRRMTFDVAHKGPDCVRP